MISRRLAWPGYRWVSASFGFAGVVCLGLIPGVGLLLLGGALLVWVCGWMMRRGSAKILTGGLWLGFMLSLAGVLIIFAVDPIIGLGVLLGGLGLTAGITVHQWLEAARGR